MSEFKTAISLTTFCLPILALLLLIGTVSAAAPDAAFSGAPLSGAAPLAVQFTDTSTGSPTGWAWFFGDETYNGTWTEQTDNAGWSRWHHASVAMPDGSIVLMGGYGDGYTGASNDTFQSTDNGTTWTVVNASSGWTPRSGHTAVALPDGSIVLMGGRDRDGNYLNDTWRSDDGGGNWTRVNVSSGWEGRWRYTSVAMPDGSIVLTGGDAGDELSDLLYNDTWRSIDGGGNWTCMNASSGWAERFGHTSVAMPDGSIVLMGGEGDDSDRQNDVWRSTDGGAHWTCMNASSGWAARYDHTSVAMPDGSIVLIGGWNLYDGQSNDVWRSTDNGTTWTQLPNAGWSPRQSHTSVAMPDGSIVLMGGGNDVWKLQPAGSNAEDPMHTYTAPGTYTVTLQASNAGGYDSTRRTDYITVTAAPVAPTANFTGTPTSGTVPLAVQFNDTSAGSPIVWNWSFGDGAWHNTTDAAERNATHTYSSAGAYTVSLTASNAAGSNTSTRTDYITVTAAGAPTAAFSGTPTTGTAPLTVSFTDASTGGPTGWAWFFSDETYGEAWTQLPNAGWSAREAHTSVAMPDGSIVLMGGYNNNRLNDTWRSTDSGATWTCVNASSGWTKRLSHAAVALPDGSIILMGGSDPTNTRLNDTWRSIDGGGNWTCVNVSSGWEGRSDSATVAMPDGSIILTGGDAGNSSVDIYYNDTWLSIDGGGNWTCMNASSGWTERFGHTTVAMPDGSIILMGGVTNNPTRMTNDTWRSTDGGAHWTCMNASSGWTARYYHTSVAMPDGSIVLMGGNDDSQSGTNTPRNDTWRSTDNGSTWTRLSESVGWSARSSHTSVAMPDGSIILMGGGDPGARNDIWRLQPAGSSLQNPSHAFTTPGTYTVTLQASNAGGYDSTRLTDYITVTVAPVAPTAAFSGTPTSGTAPLAVQFNDTSTGSPTVWNWSFGDGAWHNTTDAAERNATHTYTAAGTYTVSLTASSAGGSDTSTRADYITISAAPVPPVANFIANRTSGTAPLAIQFNDTSTGSATAWNWSFGDGAWHNTTDAAERNVTHTYTAAGTYTVSLTVDNAAGSDTLSRSGYVTVTAAPVAPTAAFSGTPTSGTAPLAVQFTDASTGGPASWAWDFGDGATSTEQSPAHTYTAAGTYTVNLTVSNAAGSNTLSRSGYVTVTAPTPTSRPVYSGGGGGGSTGGPDGYNVGGNSAVSKVNVTGTGIKTFVVTGWKQSSPGSGIPPAPGTPYQYVDLVPARFEEITGANITFSVPQTWLDEHGFTPEDIVMYHYNGTVWEALPTWVVDDSGTTVTFTATSPGFSLFAITGIEEIGAVTTPTAAQTTVQAAAEPTAEQTAAAPAGGPAPEFPLGTAALVAGAVLVLAAGGYLVWRRGVHR